jgi:hypothetical protein
MLHASSDLRRWGGRARTLLPDEVDWSVVERTPARDASRARASGELALPSLDAYIASLPQGWHSYPTCEARSGLLASLRPTGVLTDLDGIPLLGEHVRALPAVEWIPEVAHVAVLLALRDRRFSGPNGEAAFIAWMDKLNRAVLPEVAPRDAAQAIADFPAVWASLHRGTRVDVLECHPNRACLGMTSPEPIFPPLARRWRRRVIETYLSRAGASQPRANEIARVGEQVLVGVTWL